MKSLFAALLLTASLSASASPVFLHPTCNAFSGECTLYNNSGKDVSCNIHVRGQTRKGVMVTAYDYRVLYQGMFAWVRVFPNNPQDPIAYLNADAFCNTLN